MSGIVRFIRAPLGYAIVTSAAASPYVFKPSVGLSTFQSLLAALATAVTTIVICFAVTFFRHYAANPTRVKELVSEIHERTYQLTKSNCTKFRLPQDDAPFAYIRVKMIDNVAFVRYISCDEHFGDGSCPRWFEIGPRGGVACCSRDLSWRFSPLIPQLQELVRVLGACEPCFEVTKVRRREDR